MTDQLLKTLKLTFMLKVYMRYAPVFGDNFIQYLHSPLLVCSQERVQFHILFPNNSGLNCPANYLISGLESWDIKT